MENGNAPVNVMASKNKQCEMPKRNAGGLREDAFRADMRALKAEMNALIGRIHDLEALVFCRGVVVVFGLFVDALFA